MVEFVHSIPTARVFAPLLEPARYKAAYGGRGSGKSHFFAELGVEDAQRWPGENGGEGLRWVCVREVQKSLKQSAKRLVEDKINALPAGHGFRVFKELIETPGDGVILFQGMQDHTADSVKSLEGFHRAWWEEAQSATAHSLTLLRPTIRHELSELWFGWNPRRKADPVDQLFRGGTPPTGSVVVKANWSDNPWFPKVLEQERLDDLRNRPEQYDHIWEGDYAGVHEGAYFTKQLIEARQKGRIGKVAADPLMERRAFWDIGVSDHTAVWVAQFIGREIRVIDYYEAQGQPLSAHLDWLRSNGHASAVCVLPHDGGTRDMLTADKFEDHIRSAGFRVEVVKNQGKGAAMRRVEAVRRLFPSIWIDEARCSPGLEALAAYHERKDEAREIGLGPEHDWASHGADAFGLMCVAYEQPREERRKRRPRTHTGHGGFMG